MGMVLASYRCVLAHVVISPAVALLWSTLCWQSTTSSMTLQMPILSKSTHTSYPSTTSALCICYSV